MYLKIHIPSVVHVSIITHRECMNFKRSSSILAATYRSHLNIVCWICPSAYVGIASRMLLHHLVDPLPTLSLPYTSAWIHSNSYEIKVNDEENYTYCRLVFVYLTSSRWAYTGGQFRPKPSFSEKPCEVYSRFHHIKCSLV